VVAAKDDQRIIILAAGPKGDKDAADLDVQEGDGGVVIGQVLADDLRGARPRGGALVPAWALDYFFGELGGPVGRLGGLVKSSLSFWFSAKRTKSQWSVNFWR
jgi:hypothetical protein